MFRTLKRAIRHVRGPKYIVVPYGYFGVRHSAESFADALEWARCYPERDPQPLIFARGGRAVRYVR